MSFSTTLMPYLTEDKDASHLQFNNAFGSALTPFLEAAKEAGHDIRIYSGYRSPERQGQLFEQAVKKYGSEAAARKWVAPAGKSRHNHGGAADLRYGTDAARNWAHDNAQKYGLNFRMSWEPWHIELHPDHKPMETAAANSEEGGITNEKISESIMKQGGITNSDRTTGERVREANTQYARPLPSTDPSIFMMSNEDYDDLLDDYLTEQLANNYSGSMSRYLRDGRAS